MGDAALGLRDAIRLMQRSLYPVTTMVPVIVGWISQW